MATETIINKAPIIAMLTVALRAVSIRPLLLPYLRLGLQRRPTSQPKDKEKTRIGFRTLLIAILFNTGKRIFWLPSHKPRLDDTLRLPYTCRLCRQGLMLGPKRQTPFSPAINVTAYKI